MSSLPPALFGVDVISAVALEYTTRAHKRRPPPRKLKRNQCPIEDSANLGAPTNKIQRVNGHLQAPMYPGKARWRHPGYILTNAPGSPPGLLTSGMLQGCAVPSLTLTSPPPQLPWRAQRLGRLDRLLTLAAARAAYEPVFRPPVALGLVSRVRLPASQPPRIAPPPLRG